MSKIIIDGTEIDVPAEYTLLQACEAAGAEVPRFCFHERLSIAGNCDECAGFASRTEWRTASGVDDIANGEEGPRGRYGISADQPSA